MKKEQNSNSCVQFVSMREAVKITGINPQTLRILADQNKVKSYKTVSGQRKFDKNFLEQMCNTSLNVVLETTKQCGSQQSQQSEISDIAEVDVKNDNSKKCSKIFNSNNSLQSNLIEENEEFQKSGTQIKKIDEEFKENTDNNTEKINIIYARISEKNNLQNLNSQIKYIKLIDKKYENYKVVTDVGNNFYITNDNKGLYFILDLCIKKNIGDVVISHKDRIGIFNYDLIKYIIESCGGSLITLNNNKFKVPEKEILMVLLSGTYNYISNNSIISVN